MPQALLLENIHPDAAKSLRDHGFTVTTMKGALSEDELIEALDGVDLLGVRSKTTVTRKVIDARPNLSAVGCFCIGTNQVDLEYAGAHGIAVFNAPYSNTRSVVELVIGDIICLEEEHFSEDEPLLMFDPQETWKKTRLKPGEFELREIMVPIFLGGECVYTSPKTMDIRKYCLEEQETLWEESRRLANPHQVYIDLSQKLYDTKRQLLDEISNAQLG